MSFQGVPEEGKQLHLEVRKEGFLEEEVKEVEVGKRKGNGSWQGRRVSRPRGGSLDSEASSAAHWLGIWGKPGYHLSFCCLF